MRDLHVNHPTSVHKLCMQMLNASAWCKSYICQTIRCIYVVNCAEVLPSSILSKCCWLTLFFSAFVSLDYEVEDGVFGLHQTEDSILLPVREELSRNRPMLGSKRAHNY